MRLIGRFNNIVSQETDSSETTRISSFDNSVSWINEPKPASFGIKFYERKPKIESDKNMYCVILKRVEDRSLIESIDKKSHTGYCERDSRQFLHIFLKIGRSCFTGHDFVQY